ncbi:DEAD/DEAH box helicase [Allorhizobium undicola]|uniref:DEAD/DEAH box helicase n=1 Tax=Allorhizobium undicola TaxID=78527 RepID=UPI0004830F1C|nr:DEAD/DEAH box helicase [Allorhizobium undicola]
MTNFDGIVPAIAEALLKRGYETLTPVQQAMLSPDLEGQDALVSAQTGSGKTVAFGIAMASDLLDGQARFGRAGFPLALAIAPTRELALQVKRELEWLYEMTGAIIASCVGGMDIRNERRALERGAHIVVGTPGRLRDHITRGALDMSEIRAVVLDEADEMLDLGFREDLEFILEQAPEDRRTLMFSATVPRAIADLARSYQKADARRIETAAEKKQHVDIEYRALMVSPSDKENAIINMLRFYEARNAIVFCSTRANVNHLTARLHNRGFSVVALSGELSQNERTHALQAMRDGRARVCIATDVAARGIDLPGLELVIHADLPTNSETLLHRSGRTGRAGNKGVSALVVPVNLRRKAERLLDGANVRPTWALPPTADEVLARDDERLLAEATLADPVGEDEAAMVERLLAEHGAEKLAAAFIRNYRASRSAPEDLVPVTVDPQKRPRRDREDFASDGREAPPHRESRPRDAFGPSRWFSLSVGRRQNAEPRWLIPMLCRNGQITKAEIGAIKMQPEETFVEIAEDGVDQFLAAIGPNKTLDRGIQVRPVKGMPDFSASPKAPRERKPYGDRADAGARPSRPRFKDDMQKADAEVWGDAPRAKPRRDDWKPKGERPARSFTGDKPAKSDRPFKADKPFRTDKPRFDDRGPAGADRKKPRKGKSNG